MDEAKAGGRYILSDSNSIHAGCNPEAVREITGIPGRLAGTNSDSMVLKHLTERKMAELAELFDKVAHGKAQETKELVSIALSEGVSVDDIIVTMNSAMEDVGQRFSRNEYFFLK